MTTTKLTITKSQFTKLETTIETGLRTFYQVGSALKEIRDTRAYKQHLGFETFEDYCQAKFSMTRIHAHHYIAANGVRENLLTMVNAVPTNERQCRPLTKLEPEQQIEAWQAVLDKADGDGITAKLVSDVVKEMVGDVEPAAWTLGDAITHLQQAIESHVERWPPGHIEVMQKQLVDLAEIIPNFVGGTADGNTAGKPERISLSKRLSAVRKKVNTIAIAWPNDELDVLSQLLTNLSKEVKRYARPDEAVDVKKVNAKKAAGKKVDDEISRMLSGF